MAPMQQHRVYDELLLLLARNGDRKAADRLAARWQPRLMKTARRLLGDPDQARDAVQETWAGIYRGWGALKDPASFPAWAFSILHRKCADRIRYEQSARERLTGEEAAPPLAVAPRGETATALSQAFAALPPDQREAAILFFGEELSLAEIAAATDVPVGTVKSRLFAARKRLKLFLKGEQT